MALAIQHKRSSTAGSQPGASDISVGEIAINLADLKMFTKTASNSIVGIGGEDVVGTIGFTKADGTSGELTVTGFKINFKKADGTDVTYNMFQGMMLFSLFAGTYVTGSHFNTHTHSITWDDDGGTGNSDVPNQLV